MTSSIRRLLIPSCLILLITTPEVHAAQGDLDAGFGDHGRVRLDLPSQYVPRPFVAPLSAAYQADGRIVIAGSDPGLAQIRVARLLPNGQLDSSFGSAGYVQTDFGGATSLAAAVAIEPGGRILVAGTVAVEPDAFESGKRTDAAVIALKPDGSVDTTFGEDGRRVIDLDDDSLDKVTAMTLIAAGDIVLAVERDGYSARDGDSTIGLAVLRLTPQGAINATFGENGWVLAPAYFWASALVEQSDGKLVICGTSHDQDTFMVVTRLNPDGTPDESFGSAWPAGVSKGYTRSCLVQPDGRLVLAGDADGRHIRAMRLLADGSLDASFARGGVLDHALGLDLNLGWPEYPPRASDVALLADGRLVVAAIDSGFRPSVLVVGPDGVPDAAFGEDGFRQIDVGYGSGGSIAYDLRMIADESGIVAISSVTYLYATTIARLNLDDRPGASVVGFRLIGRSAGERDDVLVQTVYRSGSSEGPVSVSYRTIDETARAFEDYEPMSGVLTWSDGDASPKDIRVALLRDTATEGTELFWIELSSPLGGGLSSSKVLVNLHDPPSSAPPPPRSSPTVTASSGGGGSLDASLLALLVILWMSVCQQHRRPVERVRRSSSAALLLIAASATLESGATLAAQGDLDASFGDYGRVRLELPGERYFAASRVLAAYAPDGRIVLARTEPGAMRIRVVRLLADGQIDRTFGSAGHAQTDLGGGFSLATAIAMQPGGRILIAGSTAPTFDAIAASQSTDVALLALNADGSPDTSFGEGSHVVIDLDHGTQGYANGSPSTVWSVSSSTWTEVSGGAAVAADASIDATPAVPETMIRLANFMICSAG